MDLKIYETSKNYTATVVKLKSLEPVAGLDNLVRTTVFGNDCLVSKETDLERLFLFFPAETTLSAVFLRLNNLYRHSELNSDSTQKWFFEDSGRVKAIKFKGIISTGFVIPVDSLKWIIGKKVEKLREGDEFNEIEGTEICQKFVREVNLPGGKGNRATRALKRFDQMIPNQFRFHESTAQFFRFVDALDPNEEVIVTNKLHGTSAVFANVLGNRKLTLRDRFARCLGVAVKETEYHLFYASRTVLKNRYINTQAGEGFYKEDIWGTVFDELKTKLEKGITIYGEIVGFLESGKFIQKGYDYGCDPGKHKFYVYRITQTNADGEVYELDWKAINHYCTKYGLTTVPYFKTVKINELTVEDYLERDCAICINKVPAEGIVIRIDKRPKFEVYKAKSKSFMEYETKMIDEGTEDIEAETGTEVES